MRYRGFIITSRFDRQTEERTNGSAEECSGFCCQVYHGNDGLYENMLDEFELTIFMTNTNMSLRIIPMRKIRRLFLCKGEKR